MMKTNLEQIDDEDEDPKQIDKAKSRWGREKKMRRKKEERREAGKREKERKRKYFLNERSERNLIIYIYIYFFFLNSQL